jgi:hypothetical protein
MPYVFRDEAGKISRATVRQVVGAEMLPYDHPELVSFLEQNGQSQQKVTEALGDLRKTDVEMTRAVEDVVMALLKKNVLKMTDLPKPVQERMAYRVKLRMLIQDVYEQASGQSNASLPPSLPPSVGDVG